MRVFAAFGLRLLALIGKRHIRDAHARARVRVVRSVHFAYISVHFTDAETPSTRAPTPQKEGAHGNAREQ